jgi:hypothetical protein
VISPTLAFRNFNNQHQLQDENYELFVLIPLLRSNLFIIRFFLLDLLPILALASEENFVTNFAEHVTALLSLKTYKYETLNPLCFSSAFRCENSLIITLLNLFSLSL